MQNFAPYSGPSIGSRVTIQKILNLHYRTKLSCKYFHFGVVGLVNIFRTSLSLLHCNRYISIVIFWSFFFISGRETMLCPKFEWNKHFWTSEEVDNTCIYLQQTDADSGTLGNGWSEKHDSVYSSGELKRIVVRRLCMIHELPSLDRYTSRRLSLG